jgi:hypothetical protein
LSRRLLISIALSLAAGSSFAQQSGVASTRHNLSVSGPGELKAATETQVCKFCHVPHSAIVPQPLWGHALSKVERYEVPVLRRGKGAPEPMPQPDGSSRLCLSCHDGTVALGDLGRSGGHIAMGGAPRLERGRRGYIGTDLSGSHPISITLPEVDPGGQGSSDMGVRARSLVLAEGKVRLDAAGKMQCTTCHDAHSDRYYEAGRVPRFWVLPTVDEVCLACHELH